jgi:hypothetical protein
MEKGDLAALGDFQKLGLVAQMAHPTYDHFLPLLYAAGAVDASEPPRFFNTATRARRSRCARRCGASPVIADLIRNPQRRATSFEAWIPAVAGMTAGLSLRT